MAIIDYRFEMTVRLFKKIIAVFLLGYCIPLLYLIFADSGESISIAKQACMATCLLVSFLFFLKDMIIIKVENSVKTLKNPWAIYDKV